MEIPIIFISKPFQFLPQSKNFFLFLTTEDSFLFITFILLEPILT